MFNPGFIFADYYVPSGIDPDAQAFLTATGITDATITSAINNLVLDLKNYNLWNKCDAIYPMVGGTLTTSKYNLKNPQDTDAAFRLTVHNAGGGGGIFTYTNGINKTNGAIGSGTAYLRTHYNPNSSAISMAHSSIHLSWYEAYSQTNPTFIDNNNGQIGIITPNATYIMNSYYGGSVTPYRIVAVNVNSVQFNAVSALDPGTGLWITTRINSSSSKLYKNGNLEYTYNDSENSGLSTSEIILFGISQNSSGGPWGGIKNSTCRFASFGAGFNATESQNFNTAVQTFQTTLGRQV